MFVDELCDLAAHSLELVIAHHLSKGLERKVIVRILEVKIRPFEVVHDEYRRVVICKIRIFQNLLAFGDHYDQLGDFS